MKKLSKALKITTAAIAAIVGAAACGGGGGSGGGGDDVTIEGTLRTDTGMARVLNPGEGGIPGVEVSALGSMAITDELGNFQLSADGNAFPGGSVQFSFLGQGIDTTVILEGVPGGPGTVAYTDFILENNGQITGESNDNQGNVFGTTPGGRSLCDTTGTFVDGGLGALWKPHSESTGTVVILMQPEYRNADVRIENALGDEVSTPIRRSCCDHNGGREHIFLANTAESLLGTTLPIIVRFTFPDGRTDCRQVDNPLQRYD